MSETIKESIEFLTQIHKVWNFTEQRAAIRIKPRRIVSYEYIGMKNKESQYLRALTNNTQTQILQFPLWHAQHLLNKIVYKSSSIIEVGQEDMWNFRDCIGVMLWQNDDVGGEYFDLQSITADGVLHLKKQVSCDWPAHSTVVVPVFWGILQQEDSYVNLTSEHTNMVINVEFINRGLNVELPESVNEYNYPRMTFNYAKNANSDYLGRELFLMKPAWTDDLNANYARNANRLDNDSGIIRYDLKSEDTIEVRSLKYNAISRAEIQFLQRFFYRCRGALKGFYAPTWTHDVELALDSISGNTLYTKFDLYFKYYQSNKLRKNLIIFFRDGTIQVLKIAGFSREGEYGKIFLDMPIKTPLIKSKIDMICFLCLYRLNSDKMITDYETNDAAIFDFECIEVVE